MSCGSYTIMVNKVTWTEDSNAQTHKNLKFNNLLVKAHNRSVSEANKSRRAKVEAKIPEDTRKYNAGTLHRGTKTN